MKRGELQQKEAAALCQLEYRYLRRLYKRYCEQGDRSLVHQGRGAAVRASIAVRGVESNKALLKLQ